MEIFFYFLFELYIKCQNFSLILCLCNRWLTSHLMTTKMSCGSHFCPLKQLFIFLLQYKDWTDARKLVTRSRYTDIICALSSIIRHCNTKRDLTPMARNKLFIFLLQNKDWTDAGKLVTRSHKTDIICALSSMIRHCNTKRDLSQWPETTNHLETTLIDGPK